MIQRREFLRHLGTAAIVSAAFQASPTLAAPRIAGRNTPKTKLSLAAYSYRDQLTSKKESPAKMDLHGFIEECAAMELDGAELTGYYMPDPPSPEYLHELQAHCYQLGLSVSGTAIRSDFGWPSDSPERAKELEHVRRWIDYAAELHAPFIRIFAGHPKKGISEADTHRLMVEGIAASCAYAGQRGIYLGLENHGGPTETAAGVMKLLDGVDSPWLGVNLDGGNFRGSVDPYEQFATLIPYAVNVQVKVVMQMPDGTKNPVDYARIARLLREGNYRGFVALEFEEKGDVPAECRHHIKEMRKAFEIA